MNLQGPEDFKIIISDTSCLSILEKLNAFNLLHQLYSRVITTPEVQREFGADLPDWITLLAKYFTSCLN